MENKFNLDPKTVRKIKIVAISTGVIVGVAVTALVIHQQKVAMIKFGTAVVEEVMKSGPPADVLLT